MMTVRDKLMSEALTDADREMLAIWFDEKPGANCARQQAWEEVSRRRRSLPELRLS